MKFKIFALTVLALCIFSTQTYAEGYNRSDWPHWIDVDHDGQDSRAETLIRDSLIPVTFKTEKQRTVLSGKWICPYTGKTYFKASDIDIDHMVPLSNAYKSGADNWTKAQRKQFANDPENLFSTEDNANQSKGGRGPEDWMPNKVDYWPEYARHWIHIKEKYHLNYAPGELTSLAIMLFTGE